MEEDKTDTEEQFPLGRKTENMFYNAHPLIFKKAKELRNKLTSAEELLWNYIGQGQLGIKFRRQHPASIYVLDFYTHSIRLAIEIDGSIHGEEMVKRNDRTRQEHLESFGIKFLRFSNQQVLTQMELVLEKIKNKINELLPSHLKREPKALAPFRVGAKHFLIIPAIDIIDGKCVRLSQGDYAQKKIYNENPLEVAKQFEDAGITRLHLVDLDGAKKGFIVNQKILEIIASKTKLIIDFGGGIKSDADIQSAYNAGASVATIGSIAVRNPELVFSWVKKYGAEKILLGADVKMAVSGPNPTSLRQSASRRREGSNTKSQPPGTIGTNYFIAVNGWTKQTDISVFDFIEKNLENGVKNIFCTDISKDGMLQGPALSLYDEILKKNPSIHLIASGGVSSIDHIFELEKAGCSGVIIGKAIYEGNIKLHELKSIFF